MSDISIPGVNSRFNTESMVQELLDAESVQIKRLQEQKTTYQTEKRVWQELNIRLSNFRSMTSTLYNFENPFNERNSFSSNETLLRAQANRNADEGVTRIRVVQRALADRFISSSLEADRRIEQGLYRFTVGEELITLRFRGGTVREFSDALNRRSPDLLRSSVVTNRPGSQVIFIESLKEGESHSLGFEQDALALAEELGWVNKDIRLDLSTALPSSAASAIDENELGSIRLDQEGLSISPGGQATITLAESLNETEGITLQYELRLREVELPDSLIPTSPIVPDLGSVSLGNVRVPILSSDIDFPEVVEPEITEESSLIFAVTEAQSIALPEAQDSVDFVEVRVTLSEYVPTLTAIEIRNSNSLKEITIRNVKIVEPKLKNVVRPQNAVSSTRNAILEVEGILVERESNTIDDIIPGVVLELRKASEEEAELRVEPDRALVKDTIIEWVGRYNQIIRDVNILTRSNPEIIDEIEYFTDEEREIYFERLGLFQGDNTLNTLKQRLQRFTANTYETRNGAALSLLAQIGVSTNASQAGIGSVNLSRLRGYLEINERVLDRTLEKDFLAIKDLFGADTDGDLVIEQGLGYQIDQFLKLFVEVGGVIANRISRYDALINSSDDNIQDYEDYLENYEDNIRRDFATMESAINSLENSSQSLQNLNPANTQTNN